MSKAFKIFTDFDGTVTKIDAGNELFRRFADNESIDSLQHDLFNGRISSKEYWIRLCKIVEPVKKDEWDEFILSIEVERSFRHLVEYCNKPDYSLFILSDGFDYYIERILKQEKLYGLKFFSNSLSITSDGFLIPSFPHFNESCPGLANCIRDHVIENSGDDDFTIFIGDGKVDRAPVEFVDFIFAKNELLKYCEKQRITYFAFKDFFDVIRKLDELGSKKRLKKRYRAELKRREAYLME